MVCKNRGVYGFLSSSWVLITYNICPPVKIDGNISSKSHRFRLCVGPFVTEKIG